VNSGRVVPLDPTQRLIADERDRVARLRPAHQTEAIPGAIFDTVYRIGQLGAVATEGRIAISVEFRDGLFDLVIEDETHRIKTLPALPSMSLEAIASVLAVIVEANANEHGERSADV
jgi:hypothetical protein